MPNSTFEDLSGRVFGDWTVIKCGKIVAKKPCGQHRYWTCRCTCGKVKDIESSSLKRGKSSGCGCRKFAMLVEMSTTHGRTRTDEYNIYQKMHDRCHNPSDPNYIRYGARGIQMCAAYRESFTSFFADMGNRPSKQHSVDRVNNDGNYSCGKCDECKKHGWPFNLRWATRTEQNRNTRTNFEITWQGRTQCLAAWSEELKVDYHALYDRVVTNREHPDTAFIRPMRKTKHKGKAITFNGETRTMAEWAKHLGLTTGCLYYRIYDARQPLERALVP